MGPGSATHHFMVRSIRDGVEFISTVIPYAILQQPQLRQFAPQLWRQRHDPCRVAAKVARRVLWRQIAPAPEGAPG
jgi:hypothetical protein